MSRAALVIVMLVAGCPAAEAPRPPEPVAGAHSVPSDLARAVDLAPPPPPPLAWHLKACKNAPGCADNGVSRTCGAVGVRGLRFTVTDEETHLKTVTRAPCGHERSDGEVGLVVPHGPGPWSITATTDENPGARSEVVCHVTPGCWKRGFSMNVYALGCSDPECVACVEGNHPAGWCE